MAVDGAIKGAEMTDKAQQDMEVVREFMDSLENWQQCIICFEVQRGVVSCQKLLVVSKKRTEQKGDNVQYFAELFKREEQK